MSKVHFCVEGEELDDQGQRTGRRLPQQQQQQPRAKRWRRLKELGTAAHEFYPEGKAVMLRAYVEAGEYEDGVGPPKAKIDLVTGREGRVFGRLRMNAFEFAQFVEFFQSDAASEVAKALRQEDAYIDQERRARRERHRDWGAFCDKLAESPVAEEPEKAKDESAVEAQSTEEPKKKAKKAKAKKSAKRQMADPC